MGWKPWFEPEEPEELGMNAPAAHGPAERDSGEVYLYNKEIVAAVNVAWATGRPLLLRGRPGTGKSTLAKNVAKTLGRAFEEVVVTSGTRKEDLLWRFDAVRRLADAQVTKDQESGLKPDEAYVLPGPLWWAFDATSAATQMGKADEVLLERRKEKNHHDPDTEWVILIDEIDKADPDVPNDLLGPLGSMRFRVDPLGQDVVARAVPADTEAEKRIEEEKKRPLVFITTNEERTLPAAFVRRCVVLHLEPPKKDVLVKIAKAHFQRALAEERVTENALGTLADRFVRMRDGDMKGERDLSTAEFIDAIDAAIDLDVSMADDDEWELLAQVALRKVPVKREA